jgi:TonB-dependent receptor
LSGFSLHSANRADVRRMALGTVSGLALCLGLGAPALAQETDETMEEETAGGTPEAVEDEENVIVVSGFRASLESAQNIKRDADTFVDVVTAEDIGALPDRSVAETLQRIPGVNIGRFEKTSDPDRFSVEGTGVVIRGLPFVRSELNGRDIFSATGGRVLSFNDVSPELLGRVEVYKNVTADMIDGGIAGTVNLVTRKPLDNRGVHIAGTIEANVGDLAEEWSPGFSVLGSATYDNDAGSLGFQLGYARSELVTRTDASQVSDPCYRADTLDGPCIRALAVGDGGFSGEPLFDETNFPPAGTVVVPKGAGVRTTDLERDREAWSAVLQYEDPTGDFLMTFEWLRADTQFFTEEYAILAQVNSDALFPIEAAGSDWTFEDGIFQSGVLTQSNGGGYASPFGGIPTEFLRFQRATDSHTEDFSFDVDWSVTDRLRVNFEAQHIGSSLSRNSILGATQTWTDIAIDDSGTTPQVSFLAPQGAPADYFSSGFYTYYWFVLDSVERNEGELDSLRFDAEYDISDTGFFKRARFGARWADRERITRNTNFSTWGNLSAPWAGRAGCAPWGAGPGCGASGPGPFGNGFIPGRLYTGLPGQEFATGGGAFIDEFPDYSQFRNPFAEAFQRGNAPLPIENGGSFFFGGDDFLGEYLAGETLRQAREINVFSQTPNPFIGVGGRSYTNPVTGETTVCDPFCEPEISDVGEATKAAYARIDFGADWGGTTLEGNFGLRYVHTRVRTGGLIGFPSPVGFDTGPGGNNDGMVSVAEIQASCAQFPNTNPGVALPGYCSLSAARQAEFAAAFTGETIVDNQDATYDHWLPSFNAKLDVGDGLLFRLGVSKGISRPDLQLYRSGGLIGDNTNALLAGGMLADGPLFALQTGNRGLKPTSSWNYDLSAEWYFDDVGSLTASLFYKDISGVVSSSVDVVTYTAGSGATLDAEVNRPNNNLGGDLKGFELAYQQTYDFLPGLLSGFGTQLTYTYVDGADFSNAQVGGARRSLFAGAQPLQGISEHTVNAVVFYEKGPLSARAAYNWRSDFLITPRDDIFPYSPIWQESTGQLDASIFYAVTDRIKLGVQGVNLLDEVTRTSQVIDFDGTRVTRSAFRNDRRFTFLARFDF